MSQPDLERRAKALVDDKLIRAYWEAVEHYKTRDLVLIYAVGDTRHRRDLLAACDLLG